MEKSVRYIKELLIEAERSEQVVKFAKKVVAYLKKNPDKKEAVVDALSANIDGNK